jgi:hypothetical protein
MVSAHRRLTGSRRRSTHPIMLVSLVAVAALTLAAPGSSAGPTGRTPSSARGTHKLEGVLATSPLSDAVLITRALRAGWLTLPPAPLGTGRAAAPAPNKVAPRDVLPNVQVSEGGEPVNGPSIESNPNGRNHLVVGATDYNCRSQLGAYASSDGGASWGHTCIGFIGPGGCGEASVGYGSDGIAYVAGIGDCNGYTGSVVLSKSTDDGATWSAPVVVVPPLFKGGITDIPRLAIDQSPGSPFFGSMYISATQFGVGPTTQISLSRSTDGGATWRTEVVSGKQRFPRVDQFPSVVARPDGTVAVAWTRCKAGGTGQECAGQSARYLAAYSVDGGTTWTSPETIAQITLPVDTCSCAFFGNVPGTSERVAANVNVGNGGPGGGDPWGENGHYLPEGSPVQPPGHIVDDVVMRAPDGNWIPIFEPDPADDTWYSWFQWNSDCDCTVVVWMHFGHKVGGGIYRPWGTISHDGVHFDPNVALADVRSNTQQDGFGGHWLGLNIGVGWSASNAIAVWPDTRNKVNTQIWAGGLTP